MSVIENHLIFMNLDMKTACERCLTTTITRATHPPLMLWSWRHRRHRDPSLPFCAIFMDISLTLCNQTWVPRQWVLRREVRVVGSAWQSNWSMFNVMLHLFPPSPSSLPPHFRRPVSEIIIEFESGPFIFVLAPSTECGVILFRFAYLSWGQKQR